jgi:hypothetical protein
MMKRVPAARRTTERRVRARRRKGRIGESLVGVRS